MRFPKSHFLTTWEEEVVAITDLELGVGEQFMSAHCRVDGCWGNVWIKRLNETDYLYLFGTVKTAYLGQLYRKRWGIEAFFQNLKGRGFDLASSHLRSLDKLSKLVGLVSLSYAFCLNVGLYYHQKVQAIKLKRHGYKANSFARYGLNQLRALMRGEVHQQVMLWPLLQRLINWLKRQIAQNQTTILAG